MISSNQEHQQDSVSRTAVLPGNATCDQRKGSQPKMDRFSPEVGETGENKRLGLDCAMAVIPDLGYAAQE
jgi:hypothetical protein